MPHLSAEERAVLEHLRAWYRTHRGALPAERVAEATGLSTDAVCDAAGVLAVAAGVRTYHGSRQRPARRGTDTPAAGPAGASSVLFLDAPQPPRRVVNLTAGPLEAGARGLGRR
ncbi:hypothetical protein [Kineococcus gypseus]|uniref:hypothetical protein n=1 Tax=Kineococcus gypseus TaxID=1637102 RepID=UPI003D7D6646